MIISCPECSTKFSASPNHFARAPKKVRCGKCLHVWTIDLLNTSEAQVVDNRHDEELKTPSKSRIPISPIPDIVATKVINAKLPRRGIIKRLSIIFCIVFLIALSLFAAILFVDNKELAGHLRGFSVHNMVEQVKLKISPSHGLLFKNIKVSFNEANAEQKKFVVDGTITNSLLIARPLPYMILNAIGVDGKVVGTWRLPPPNDRIAADTTLSFHYELPPPDKNTVRINIDIEP